MRQEQEDASTEVTEVGAGILRLQLPIQFTGLGHVNTYALEDARGFALVDPGLPGEASWNALGDRMRRAGIPLERVHTVIVTHSHPDHFGGAGLLAERSGAQVVASEHFNTWWDPSDDEEGELDASTERGATDEAGGGDEAPEPDRPAARIGDASTDPFDRPTPWSGKVDPDPAATRRRVGIALTHAFGRGWFRTPHLSTKLADADRISLAGRDWVALHTPGHTSDHLCLYDPETGTLLSGDHVLPSITPHISGMLPGDPLARFFASLDRVAQLDGVQCVLPAHGHPFADLCGRVDEIKAHHDQRLAKLAELSDAAGWATVVDLSHRLFHEKAWGSMAESETYAHLEHLRNLGRADRRETPEGLHYLVRQ